MQHFSVDISQSKFAALKLVGEGSVIDTELMEDRGLEIMDVDGIGGGIVSVVVGVGVAGGVEPGQKGADAARGGGGGEAGQWQEFGHGAELCENVA